MYSFLKLWLVPKSSFASYARENQKYLAYVKGLGNNCCPSIRTYIATETMARRRGAVSHIAGLFSIPSMNSMPREKNGNGTLPLRYFKR